MIHAIGTPITIVEIPAAPLSREDHMKSTLASLLIAAAALVGAAATPVHAQSEYPWCGHLSIQGGLQSCTFSTLEQCRAYISGAGYCQTNPRASALAEMPKRVPRR
jgi:hypothetical protein